MLRMKDRLLYTKGQMLQAFKKVFPYILVGVGVGAVIHTWIPVAWVQTTLGTGNALGVPPATLICIPMYAAIAIAACGVMSTPALAVDGKVVSTGRVLTAQQAEDAIRNLRAVKG